MSKVCLYDKMLFHTEEYMRNLKSVLYQFGVSLCLGVSMLEAENDNLVPIETALHPAYEHYLIETSQGKVDCKRTTTNNYFFGYI